MSRPRRINFAGPGQRLGGTPRNAMVRRAREEDMMLQQMQGGYGSPAQYGYAMPYGIDPTSDQAVYDANWEASNQQNIYAMDHLMNRDMQHAEMQTSRLQTLGQQQQQVTEIAGDYNIRMNKEVAKQKAQGRKYHEKRRETALEKQHEARRQRQEIEDQADRESEAHQNRLSAMENEETIRQETRNRARRERHEKKMAELDAQVEATRENAEKSGRVVAELRNRRRQRTMQAAIEQEQSSSNTFAQTRTRQKQPKTKTELETDAMLDNFFADGSGVPTAGPSTNQAPAPVMHPQAFQGMQAPGFHPGIQHPGMFVPGQQGQWGQHPQRMLPAPRPAEPLPWENMTQQMGNMNLGRGQRMATPQPVPMRQGRVPAMANTRRPASRPPSNDGIESEDEFDSGEEVD